MRIQDLSKVVEATGDAIDAAMGPRLGAGLNSFWLSHGDRRFPVLSVLVNGDLATLHYFPFEGHSGFRSLGSLPDLNPDGRTTFVLEHLRDEQPTPNTFVVSLADALRTAKEFAGSQDLPKSLNWFEL
jgi:hypothetical protein